MGEGVAQALELAPRPGPVARADRPRAPPAGVASRTPGTSRTRCRRPGASAPTWRCTARSGAPAASSSLQPRFVEIKGERADRGALEAVTVPEGELLRAAGPFRRLPARAQGSGHGGRARPGRRSRRAPPVPSAPSRASCAARPPRCAATRNATRRRSSSSAAPWRSIRSSWWPSSRWAASTRRSAIAGRPRRSSAPPPSSTRATPSPTRRSAICFLTAPRRLFEQAVEAYTKALELRPFYADAYVGLGDARPPRATWTGRSPRTARRSGFNPLNPRVHVSLGKIYYAEKRLYFESVTAYKKAMELDPMLSWTRGWAWPRSTRTRDSTRRRSASTEGGRAGRQEYRRPLQPRPRLREGGSQGGHPLWERYIRSPAPLPSEKDWVDVARLHLRKLKSQFKD